MKFIVKARALPIGTVTERKGGAFRKEDAHRWRRVKALWGERVAAATKKHRKQADLDNWLAARFAEHKKPIAHLLFVCRALIIQAPENIQGGVKELCQAILKKAYADGPNGFSIATIETLSRGFSQMLGKKGKP